MNTPHERLTRTMFWLPLGEVHALVGGAVNARPLLFLHGFPDHPPTTVPFLEHLAETHRVVAPWLRGYAPSPIVGPYDLDTLALIDRHRHCHGALLGFGSSIQENLVIG
jgi:pimeloyl-ACP methyl ester carboxylesterase